ncbi:MAG: extracellular solute-binding protein [Actinobacteria bacterium]|nr:extracellular solute-binding protein [Actinomycetota bacterium]
MVRNFSIPIAALVLLVSWTNCTKAQDESDKQTIKLRAWGVPTSSSGVSSLANLRVLEEFQKKFPYIKPVSSTGIRMPGGSRTMNMVPLMQIAGDIPAHVMYVNFRQSDTYIRNKFLYPLDKYIEKTLGLDITNGQNMELDEYLAELAKSPEYETEIEPRIPHQCWEVMRRECPYKEKCLFAKVNGGQWEFDPTEKHYHVWAFPQGPLVTALLYRKDLFHEAGLPDRVPRTNEEFFEFAKKLTNPAENRFGVNMPLDEVLSYRTLSFLYSAGGRLVDRDENGEWRCLFDSPEAVEAYFFVARLVHEPFKGPDGKTMSSVVYSGETRGGQVYVAMQFANIDQRVFRNQDPNVMGFGPVPLGPTGKRGSEFNSRMTGIFAGLEGKDKEDIRDAAWEYIRFYDGPEARKIRTKVYVEHGLGRFVQPDLLRAAGYEEYIRQIPKGWPEAYQEALKTGVPEPYGKNCQNVYSYASKGINQIQTDKEVKEAIVARKEALDAGDAALAAKWEGRAKERIRDILKVQVRISNDKMLDILEPTERKKRNTVATIVAVSILVIFVLLFRKVFKVFDAAQLRDPGAPKGKWQFTRYKWAYLLLVVPVGSVILWQYYPLARGTVISFQNYNIRGFYEWVGMANFASALYDVEFWYSLWVTLKYALLFMLFGFTAPIVLAFLLTEVPKGKILYRTIYYLPAVLTGLIVIYLWKSFYGQYGMINQAVNFFVHILNWLPGVQLAELHKNWLRDPQLALICILLPAIWAGMGPGCLIYLAALKTVPEEIYEAADIDGAGILHKVFYVAIPNIKALIMINFIGVMVATMKGSGNMALAMTGGGPYTPYGQTEFVGLKIFFQAFGYLRFGVATAMAWILGSMLVGFTVIQLQKLSKMEFKTAAGIK